jgi:hypothetical protein
MEVVHQLTKDPLEVDGRSASPLDPIAASF